MNIIKETSLSDDFKSLYCEFISYINQSGFSNRVLIIVGGKPSIDFQFTIGAMGGIGKALEIFTSLPSYSKVVEKTAYLQNISQDEVTDTNYGIFAYLFSDIANALTPPQANYIFSNANNLSDMVLDDMRLSRAIANALDPYPCIERENKYLIVFDNLQIDSDIRINNDINLIKLDRCDVQEKFESRYDDPHSWGRVLSAFEVSEEHLKNESFIPALSSLIRLYKKGDIRFNHVAQKANHLFRGEIYIDYKNSYGENEYYEHAPSTRNDAWRQYLICDDERLEFAKFISSNLNSMSNMSYSCHIYNMVYSSPLHLRIPLLFFVIESFFADVTSEVVFKISLYITLLLQEDISFMKKVKNLYDIRSCVAHGDLANAKHKINKMKLIGFSDANDVVETILNNLWKVLLVKEWIPSKSAELISPLLLKSAPSNSDK